MAQFILMDQKYKELLLELVKEFNCRVEIPGTYVKTDAYRKYMDLGIHGVMGEISGPEKDQTTFDFALPDKHISFIVHVLNHAAAGTKAVDPRDRIELSEASNHHLELQGSTYICLPNAIPAEPAHLL